MTKLIKDDFWYVWNPKTGRYKGRTVYASFVNNPIEEMSTDSLAVILAFKSKKNNKMTCHKGQITLYQLQHNCEELKNLKLIQELDLLFVEYKPKWEEMRLWHDAKSLLLKNKFD